MEDFSWTSWSKKTAGKKRARKIDVVRTHGHALVVAALDRGTLSTSRAHELVKAGARMVLLAPCAGPLREDYEWRQNIGSCAT
jgi:hypothetical protein